MNTPLKVRYEVHDPWTGSVLIYDVVRITGKHSIYFYSPFNARTFYSRQFVQNFVVSLL